MRSLRRVAPLVAVIAAIAMIVGLGGCSGGTETQNDDGAPAASNTVTEQNSVFSPATLEVKVGDTVTFTNEDAVPHEVLIEGQSLGSQTQGQSVTWSAASTGSYPYSCAIHPTMTGTIEVK